MTVRKTNRHTKLGKNRKIGNLHHAQDFVQAFPLEMVSSTRMYGALTSNFLYGCLFSEYNNINGIVNW